MHVVTAVVLLIFSSAVSATNILLSNDDGWAEANIRAFYDALTLTGHSVVLSAPAENKSGSGPKDAPPEPVSSGCEFASCPPDSPPTGSNSSESRFNYVNSYPATSVKYGLDTSKAFFGDHAPSLVVTGPNVGSNLDFTKLFSGTVGAAQFAARNASIPAIAFSGRDGNQTAWNVNTPQYSTIYATLATTVVNTLVSTDRPHLPPGVFLNVNFPSVGQKHSCSSASHVSFVLTRCYGTSNPEKQDFPYCGTRQYPTEAKVLEANSCYASISVAKASNTFDASWVEQAIVLKKLGAILSCFK
ncbi:hypothetical protein MMC10_009932 [Thelotrema lepadinum]|nr:hypothetical protein [Thelotrema lepadinum]